MGDGMVGVLSSLSLQSFLFWKTGTMRNSKLILSGARMEL
jgi:hypothetical protein